MSEHERTISLHGLGFIQIKLPGEQRLHVWHPDLPRRKCFEHSGIHNHRFGFESHVLVGCITDILHTVSPAAERRATHTVYSHHGARLKTGNRPWTAIADVEVKLAQARQVRAGLSYVIRPYDYHSTSISGDGRAATLMKKRDVHAYPEATSLCAAGVLPEADFDRFQLDDDDLWTVALEVLGGGEGSA